MPSSAGFGLVLEFELHRGGGRRPDLIILENGTVLVVEFKNRVEPEASDFDQVRGYVRDLEEYHAGCRDRQLVPVLVPIGSSQSSYERDGVHVTSPSGLSALIRPLPVAEGIIASDGWWMLGITVLLFPLMFTGLRINRWEGALLLAVYGSYLAVLLARQ